MTSGARNGVSGGGPDAGPGTTRPAGAVVSSSRRLAGLESPVDLWRDAWGIPHVRAQGAMDAWFAMGFVHASDRLWQMDLLRRRTTGRHAEWVGAAALPMDLLVRRMNLAACCRRDAEAAAPATRAMLRAYTAGVNAAIAHEPLPPEYAKLDEAPEAWEDWHCLAVLRQTSFMLNPVYPKLLRALALPVLGAEGVGLLRMDDGGQDRVINPPGGVAQRLMPDLEALGPVIAALLREGPPDAAGGGSNAWVLDASRTATGRPLLAGDPHRLLDIPNMYLQCHVACDEFDVVGMTSPGVPGFPHFAHNRDVAWGVTVAFVDTADLYIERFKEEGRQYLLRAEAAVDGRPVTGTEQWAPTTRRSESVRVRGQDAPVPCEVFVTARGPVVAGDPRSGRALVLRHASEEAVDHAFDCLAPMMRATGVEALFDACRGWGLIDHNLVAADVHGHIGHMVRARVPRRPAANGWLPVPGWVAAHDWQGWIPFEEMPRQIDPPGGGIVTANNRVIARHAQYLSTDCHPPHRARRIEERLAALPAATVADMEAVHRDTVSIPALELCARLRGLVLEGAGERPAAALRERLLAWDGRMDPDSTAATAYVLLRLALARELALRSGLAALELPRLRAIPPGISVEYHIGWSLPQLLRSDDRSLLGGADWDAVLRAALQTVAAEPEEAWGARHRLLLRHPLGPVFREEPLFAVRDLGPVGGDNDTVFTTGYVPQLGLDPAYASQGRYVFDVGDWDRSRWIVFHGAAGRADHPHYEDQSGLWREGRTVPMHYDWTRIAAEAGAHCRWLPQ